MEILVSMLKIDENKNWCCCIAMHLFNVQNAANFQFLHWVDMFLFNVQIAANFQYHICIAKLQLNNKGPKLQ
jgi:tryptophan-rich sensory protein